MRGRAAPRTDVFKDFPIADRRQDRHRGDGRRHGDQSWYVALAPYPIPHYVVAVTIEDGGFGAETAAPGRAPDPRLAAGLEVDKKEAQKVVRDDDAGGGTIE